MKGVFKMIIIILLVFAIILFINVLRINKEIYNAEQEMIKTKKENKKQVKFYTTNNIED